MIRWCISPLVVTVDAFGRHLTPKVSLVFDPGRIAIDRETSLPIPKTYSHKSVINFADESWCLSRVKGVDLTALSLEADILDVLQRDYGDGEDFLLRTQREEGWTGAKRTRLARVLSDRGIDTSGLDLDAPFRAWIQRLADNRNAGVRIGNR